MAAGDFFVIRYPQQNPVFLIPLIYLVVTLLMCLLTTCAMVACMSLRWRLRAGYGCFFFSLGLTAAVNADFARGSYVLLLGSVAITSIGSGLQQSSFYGSQKTP